MARKESLVVSEPVCKAAFFCRKLILQYVFIYLYFWHFVLYFWHFIAFSVTDCQASDLRMDSFQGK